MSVPGDKIDWSDPEQVRQYKNERGREWYERNKEKAQAQKREAAKTRRDADPEAFREYERAAKEKLRREKGVAPRKQYRIDEEGRECSGKCGLYKVWGEFSPSKTGTHDHETRCRKCKSVAAVLRVQSSPEARAKHSAHVAVYQKTEAGKATARRSRLKYRYGVTNEQYLWMHEQQGGACYFCGLAETVTHHASEKLMNFGVEHDHDCDQGHDPKRGCRFCVRGLACYNCNIFIERVERSPILRPRLEDLLARRPLLAADAPQEVSPAWPVTAHGSPPA